MNIISYSLFKPRKFYDHRTWDDDKHNENRYFFNIPALCAVNRVLYPEFSMHLTVCPATESNPLFYLYQELCSRTSFFSYSVNNEEYEGHEPALWRIGLLWKKGVNVLLSRDLDSLPNREEYQATRCFNDSNKSVHTIRSHEHHFNYPCRMLIGLSGFRPSQIPPEILTESFNIFKKTHAVDPASLNNPTVKWNADQLTIINAFTTNDFFTAEHFLDSKINNQQNYQDFFCKRTDKDELESINFSSEQSTIIDLVERGGLTEWAGEPCDARGKFLRSACETEGSLPIMDIVSSNKHLEEFYLR